MISIYGAEFAKAVSSQSGWIDYAIQNTPGTNPEMNNVSGFNLDPAGFFLVGDPNPHYGGISVLWTSEYELDSSVAGYYYVLGGISNIFGGAGRGNSNKSIFFICEICSGGSRG